MLTVILSHECIMTMLWKTLSQQLRISMLASNVQLRIILIHGTLVITNSVILLTNSLVIYKFLYSNDLNDDSLLILVLVIY